MRFLPGTSGLRWAHADLGRLRLPDGPEPDWARMAELVRAEHARLDADASYGGWMEDRSALLAHTYLAKDRRYVHLGVDFNVVAGQPVTMSLPGTVELVDDDAPEPHGWGPRAVVRIKTRSRGWVRLVYAHLGRGSIQHWVRPGGSALAGELIGCVWFPPENGGWWPHLHVQAVSERAWDRLAGRVADLDGYGREGDADLASNYPDPLPLLLEE